MKNLQDNLVYNINLFIFASWFEHKWPLDVLSAGVRTRPESKKTILYNAKNKYYNGGEGEFDC